MKNEIKLYQFEDCPFCAKVRAKLDELKFEYKKINVSEDGESKERKKLFEKSGIQTVPVIEIDGEFIGESDSIIKRLDELKNK